MTMDRRSFCRLGGGLLATAPFAGLYGCIAQEPWSLPAGLLVSASADSSGGHYLTGFDLHAGAMFSVVLPLRGHASTLHPSFPHVVLVARRPGTEMYVVDLAAGQLIDTLTSSAERHFQGHAVFDATGTRLYATENVFDASIRPDLTARNSVVGIFDATDGYRRLGEISTHGVGAHDLALVDGGQTLAIANGGIYTHPSRPREKLNLDSMDPSLAYVDVATGDLVASYRLPDHQLSVRHIASSGQTMAVAAQYQGPGNGDVAVIALQRGAEIMVPLDAPAGVFSGLDHYVASVAMSNESDRVVVTSPRGSRIEGWRLSDGVYIGGIDVPDVSGLAALGAQFVASSGTGQIVVIDGATMTVGNQITVPGQRWDNHLVCRLG